MYYYCTYIYIYIYVLICTYIYIALQDFILEHYSEDGVNYEEAIADLMETRQVSY